jgi:CheY-like chemotaxis protein
MTAGGPILYVSASERAQVAHARALSRLGLTVIFVASLHEAVRYLQLGKFQLVLAGPEMSRADLRTVLEKAREREVAPKVALVYRQYAPREFPADAYINEAESGERFAATVALLLQIQGAEELPPLLRAHRPARPPKLTLPIQRPPKPPQAPKSPVRPRVSRPRPPKR